jgi:hypothetical protein
MKRMEKGALAEDNRKAQMIEDNIQRYEEKKTLEERQEADRRKKKHESDKSNMYVSLNMQISEKKQRGEAYKNINDHFMTEWNDKVQGDIRREN